MPTLDDAFAAVERAVADGLVPGAVAAVGTAAGGLRRACYGLAQAEPVRRPLVEHALFDVASLTKIVVTATLALRYVERGLLFLDQRAASVLPEFGAAGKGDVTVRQLLSHTAGLPAWVDLHSGGGTRRAAVERALHAPLARPAGTAVVYSDVGFVALGELLAAAGGAPLDRLAREDVLEPLGMHDSRFKPPARLRARCVATEVVAERGGALVGTVHDENAAALGGVGGHAGLFSTCADLERFCRLWAGRGTLDGARFLSPATVAAATRDQTGNCDPARRRGLGWVLQPNPYWPAADLASPSAYSHTGFTGTSVVVDPERDLYAVLLTNRVHPTREARSAERIRTLRARFHNAVWAALG